MEPRDELDALLVDYAEARDDERHFVTLQGTALTLALTALTFLSALAVLRWRSTGSDVPKIPEPIVAAAPMIVMAILAFAQSAGGQSVIRSFYMRSLEREIRRLLDLDRDLADYPSLRPISLAEINATYTTMSSGGPRGASSYYRFMTGFIFVGAFVSFGGLVFSLAWSVSMPWRMTMILVYGSIAAAIVHNSLSVNRRGRELFKNEVSFTARRLDASLLPLLNRKARTEARSLASYLVLPRPDDLVKGLFVIMGMLFAGIATSYDPSLRSGLTFREAVLFVLAVEYLIYQSRYQWNDIRGRYEDRSAPGTRGRGRLPEGDAAIAASLAVMTVRIFFVVVFVTAARGGDHAITHIDRTLLTAIPLIYGLALPYELVRSRTRRTGRCSKKELSCIVFLVGLGYPIRFGLGWAAVGGGSSFVLVMGLVGIWGLGVAFVTLTWVLEAGSYVTIRFSSESQDAYYGRYEAGSLQIARKPHLLTLFRAVGFTWVAPSAASLGRTRQEGKNIKWLLRTPRRAASIWNLGLAIYILGLGAAAGALTANPELHLVTASLLSAVAMFAAASVATDFAASAVASTVMLVAVLGESLLSGLSVLTIGSLTATALLPVSIIAMFRWNTYERTRGTAKNLIYGLAGLMGSIFAWFVGKDGTASPDRTARSLRPDQNRDRPWFVTGDRLI